MNNKRAGIEGIEEMLKDLLGETLGKLKGKSNKCECLICKCMDAIEDVLEEEFQTKGEDYQKAVRIIDSFARGTGSDLTEVGIASGNTANTLKNVLENIVKDYVPVTLSYKVIKSRGYKGI